MATPKESNGCLWVFLGNPIAWMCWLAAAGLVAQGAGVPIPDAAVRWAGYAFAAWVFWLIISSLTSGPADDHWTDRGRP